MPKIQLFIFLSLFFQLNCVKKASSHETSSPSDAIIATSAVQETTPIALEIKVGAERFETYLPLLEGKRVAMVVNQTSRVNEQHLVDALQSRGVALKKIFALEHGFRGTADAGATITNGVDDKSGLPIVSLYGKNKEPKTKDLADVDLILFDIQDVGARFYTYISSLHYVMQGAAKNNKEVIILDRPNPNGHYVDGPVLDMKFTSFIGKHPIPVVHGMTIGEYGQMINGEGWLDDGLKAPLTVIPCANYERSMRYDLPVRPSPNLPNEHSILLYPSLCFFEGTIVSVGRGTNTQFQVYGHPEMGLYSYMFTPRPGPGAKDPKLNGQACYGKNLAGREIEEIKAEGQINLSYLLDAYEVLKDKGFFSRPDFFDLLAGSDQLRKQIEAGKSEAEIRASWQIGLLQFKAMRTPYLLY